MSLYKPVPESIYKDAQQAVEQYLGYAQETPPLPQLQDLVGKMKPAIYNDISIRSICGGAYFDLACHPIVPAKQKIPLINKAVKVYNTEYEQYWEALDTDNTGLIIANATKAAYADKYKAAFTSNELTMDHETSLFSTLVTIGEYALKAPRILRGNVSHAQTTLGVHLLNARFNLKYDEVLQHVWPALPRQENPRDVIKKRRTNWNLGVSSKEFLDPQATKAYITGTGVTNLSAEILELNGSFHMQTDSSLSVVQNVLREQYPSSNLQAINAAKALDKYERFFLMRLGWTFPDLL